MMNWKNITDDVDLPKCGREVLVAFEDARVYIGRWHLDSDGILYWRCFGHCDPSKQAGFENGAVAWQPLPEYPDKDKK